MKLPRDLSGARLIKSLARLGYVQVRQTGSPVRLVTAISGVHHITVPLHDPCEAAHYLHWLPISLPTTA